MLQKLIKIRKFAAVIPPLVLAALVVFLWWYLRRHSVALFASKGIMAEKERNLMYFALLLSIIVVVPVFILLITFLWRYREQNTKAKYSPDLDGNRRAEALWWSIPAMLILVLSIVTWNSSHALDPFRPLASNQQPLRVQVVSLDWKWLFIYPDENVASVNTFHMPLDRPINLELTSDAPMNSFWIPQLSGQIYTMPGMSTQLHIEANKAGSYYGESANISGRDFADMHFDAVAETPAAFESWLTTADNSSTKLTMNAYDELAAPGTTAPRLYGSVAPGLYTTVVDKYMIPGQDIPGSKAMEVVR